MTARIDACGPLEVRLEELPQEGHPVVLRRLIVHNGGLLPIVLNGWCVAAALPAAHGELRGWHGSWGHEWSPEVHALDGRTAAFRGRHGRSAGNGGPQVSLHDDVVSLAILVATAGLWSITAEPRAVVHFGAPDYELSVGAWDVGARVSVAPGESWTSPYTVWASVPRDQEATLPAALVRWERASWLAPTRLAPVVWNTWWPYEDADLSESVVRENAVLARDLGFEAVVVDAGWFGPSDPAASWVPARGDWHLENRSRFPAGMGALAREVKALGLEFGIWCEIEALADESETARSRPELGAKRQGESLGLLCLGHEAGRQFAVESLERLIGHGATWIKVDFNLGPGTGCDRSDHDHGVHGGLEAHYAGLESVLATLRQRHPGVLWESCSSGGLRTDLATLRTFDLSFLSDPDWPAHGLQVFWGFAGFYPPERAYHFSWSQVAYAPWKGLDWNDGELTSERFTFGLRIGLLGAFGLSYRLPEMPRGYRDETRRLLSVYRERIRPRLAHCDLYRLTGQPLRDGGGDPWAAFQFHDPRDGAGWVLAFRLGSGATRVLPLVGLEAQRTYLWSADAEAPDFRADASQLTLTLPEPQTSALLWYQPA